MKKILISMLAFVMLTSCSKDENNNLVPIRLGAAVETKAPVTVSATVQIEGWENVSDADYTTASTWKADASVSVVAAAAAITLSPVQYYNASNDIHTYVKGWYPKVASANGIVTFNNDNGTEDILLSNIVSGTKGGLIGDDMVFKHQTAQLIFNVIKGTGLADGTKIKSITVTGASVPTSITLGATDVVNYTVKPTLTVPDLTTAIEIPETATKVGGSLMVQPVENNTTLKLNIETVKADGTTVAATYSDIPFTTDGGKIEMGKAYTITLTFGQAGISIDANITDWVSAAGAGTVQ